MDLQKKLLNIFPLKRIIDTIDKVLMLFEQKRLYQFLTSENLTILSEFSVLKSEMTTVEY